MGIKAGYKQAEVGVIPEDWEISQMKELFTFQNGVNAEKNAYGKGIPFINVLEVITYPKINTFRIPGRVTLSTNIKNKFKVQCGDLLFNRTSETLGEVGLTSVFIDKDDVVFGGFVIRARPINSRLNSIFITHILRLKNIRTQIVSRGQGAIRANIGQYDLGEIIIYYPSIKEQEAIAKALSDVDALIESLEQLIAKKRLIKQGAMQELLTGKRRLSGFEKKKGYKQTEVGMIPEDWECVKIGDSIDLLTGFPFPSSGYSDSGIRLLRGSNVKRGVLDWSEEITVHWPVINPEIRNYILQNGDIVIAMDGSLVGRSFAMLSANDVPSLLLQRVARIRSNSIDQRFLKTIIYSQRFTEYCDSVKTITAIPHISPSDIRSFSVALPQNKDEQRAIASILFDMDAEIESLEAKLSKYRSVKQGMMHELLTGRKRLV